MLTPHRELSNIETIPPDELLATRPIVENGVIVGAAAKVAVVLPMETCDELPIEIPS